MSGRLRRLWNRLSGGVHLERLAAIDEKVGKFGRAQRESLAAQHHQLEALTAQLGTRAGADAVRALERRVDALQASLAQQDRTFTDALERSTLFDEQAVDDRRFARRMEQLRRHDRPVVVGPWTGEVGFELLYWVPFVRWTMSRYGIDPARVTVVSRGGVSSWYAPFASSYVDVFSYFSPAAFRAATEDAKKQRRVGQFDADILARVRAAHGLEHSELVHPGMMYRLFNPFWKELATPARVDAYTRFARLECRDDEATRGLPADYVAARFYFSDCFPDTPANREFVAATIESIGRHKPVVLLNAPFAVDDHRDYAASGSVISIADRMTPERNLGQQTAVIAGARAFVGTYGGYSYLAPFLGVPALGLYSARTFKVHHLHLAQRAFEQLGGASVVALDTAQLPLVQLAAAGIAVTAR